jgi:hypothetical protein
MALGDQVGEASGKITGTRVLTPVGGEQQVQMEVSFQGSGNMLGEEIIDTATYLQVVRPGGVFYGEGDALWITSAGESAHFAGFGVGRPTGGFPAGHFAVCGSAQTASEKLARLNSVAIVAEYDVDEDGSYRWTLWEWK